jgi:hypothetical protein
MREREREREREGGVSTCNNQMETKKVFFSKLKKITECLVQSCFIRNIIPEDEIKITFIIS